MKTKYGRLVAGDVLCSGIAGPLDFDSCNVVWDTQSGDSSGSMPIGNGDLGLNVWVEDNGDILFLIGKTDAWDENHRLLKLGRVRVSFSPSPFSKGIMFRQELRIREGMIEITGGKCEKKTTARIWVDANRPVINIECEGPDAISAEAKLELWRTERKPFGPNEQISCLEIYGWDSKNRPKDIECFVTPDTVVGGRDRLIWYHRNDYSVWPISMKLQGLEALMATQKDPLLNRTFGGALFGLKMEKHDNGTLKSVGPAPAHRISIVAMTSQSTTAEAWERDIAGLVKQVGEVNVDKARAQHEQWWVEFWNRSWVRIGGDKEAGAVTLAYTLQRWIQACSGRGAYPIKFNGSIFTVELRDGGEVKSDPDYRRWGGDYWWQNTRLPYWPMLTSGDHDLMRPLFRMYGDTLELARERTRIWHNCEGAFSTETLSIWGGMANGDYGWKREGRHVSAVDSPYVQWYWTSGLELAFMMLNYYEYTQDGEFLTKNALPWADAIVLFFDTHFKRNEDGKLVLDPIQSLETYQSGVINDTPNIAGLHAVLERLAALPEKCVDATARKRWLRMQEEIPPIPVAERDGKKYILPAETFEGRKNIENPELYSVFPFRRYGMGKPDLDVAQETFAVRVEKARHGWQQNSMQAAMLGLTAAARQMLSENAISKDPGSRFPAFWGPNWDWIPDQCHGGNILNTTQLMLMQTEGKRILLFPAWPKDWNVEFKLHAPYGTTVEGRVIDGRLTALKVSPEERRADVVICGEIKNASDGCR